VRLSAAVFSYLTSVEATITIVDQDRIALSPSRFMPATGDLVTWLMRRTRTSDVLVNV
jgi:hypothetical protein